MSLPKGYKRLEYIKSDGSSYIDSGFVPNQDTRVYAEAVLPIASSTQALFGCRVSSSSRQYQFVTQGGYYRTDYNTTINNFTTHDYGTAKFYLDKDKNFTDLNGEYSSTHTYASFTCPGNMYIFATNNNGAVYAQASAKLYCMRVYDNGTLVRDFIPCQNASGAVGLWDAENEVFYGNAGTGAFTAGPVVSESVDESEITELEYIQSSGTQYIDTGIVGKTGVKTFLDFTIVSGNLSDFIAVGCAPASYSPRFYPVATQSGKWAYGYSGWVNSSTTATTGQRYAITTELISGRQRMTVGSSAVASGASTTSVDVGLNMFLFGANIGGVYKSYGSIRVYAFQVYDNGLLERDYIPAMLTSGEVGLYDRVFHEFYQNAGTGEFTAGPEVQTAPKAPANFRVVSESGATVVLAWDVNEDAAGYRLYRSGQLLADTTETSVSVTVEPFAGAVFTVTAYNEIGEGAGAELTYFNAPDNPIPFLVTDRTRQDVAAGNAKGYYSAADLNRVGYSMKYVADRIAKAGVAVSVSPRTDWTDGMWMDTASAAAYLADLSALRKAVSAFSTTPEVPPSMAGLTYEAANNIELILTDVDLVLTYVYVNLLYAGEIFAGEV